MKSPKKRETLADILQRRTDLGRKLAELLKSNAILVKGYHEKFAVEKALREWDNDLKP